jgi:molecular chaperone GrpE
MAFWNWKKSKMETNNTEDQSVPHGGPSGSEPDDGDTNPLHAQIAELKAQLEESNSQRLRLLADYQNYQRRSKTNEALQYAEGMAKVVSGVVGVVDHFDIALMQDPARANAAQIIDGVKVIRSELLKVLANAGVGMITPAPNDTFEPGKHEAVMQQTIEGIESGHIAMMLQPGYAIQMITGERVLRAAKVAVAPIT